MRAVTWLSVPTLEIFPKKKIFSATVKVEVRAGKVPQMLIFAHKGEAGGTQKAQSILNDPSPEFWPGHF